ncbi:Zn-dependent protease with chaperone function [Chryseomicrobium aureum]|uniref:M48 family metallopeptidase n=1 Tax=Chryseomicrobium aureum TaxID=1441723 RepID=UPI00195DC8D8|nr:M48 family metallopeptidase [Chryseomicrobium aureum]MBM7707441.1 Zn-dependent protease with chaperone function [Chryseomicrobium aureum]
MQSSQIQSSRETLYFIISLLFSILIYIVAIVSVVGIAIALLVAAFIVYIQLMMLGSIRGNGVRIHQNQFPEIYARTQQLARDMGLAKTPDIFVVQSEGALNAFATRFLGRDMVVLYSEVFELAREQGQDELDFIIAHELAHVKRRHVWKNLLILPAGFIPFLSQAYSRSCEYTCDRHAAYMIQNPAAAKRALTLLGMGKGMYKEVNEDAYVQQIETESNAIVWLAEVLSTHPRIPKRVQAISQFAQTGERPYFPNTGKIIGGMAIITAVVGAIYIGSIVLLTTSGVLLGSLFASALDTPFSEGSGYDEPIVESAGQTPLMLAAQNGDIEAMELAIASGDTLTDTDEEGSDALMYAVYGQEPAAVEYLLEQGADPNTSDDYSTALVTSVFYGDREVAEMLLEYGADPEQTGPDGMTIYDVYGNETIEEVLDELY